MAIGCKVFSSSSDLDLQSQVNKWLTDGEKGKNFRITHTSQSSSICWAVDRMLSEITLTIIYEIDT